MRYSGAVYYWGLAGFLLLGCEAIFSLCEAILLPISGLRILILIGIVSCAILTAYSARKSIRRWIIIQVNAGRVCVVLGPRSHKAEQWLINLSYWIPRKYREAIAGDILEDCHEMRRKRFSEGRIRIHVLWQITIAVIALWPEAIGSAIAAIVNRVWEIRR